MTTIHHRTINVDGLDVFYREAGKADAPAILLLHGFPSASHMFRDLIPVLAPHFRVVAPDLPGFGQTDRPSRDTFAYTFDSLAKVIEGFTEKVGLSRYALYVFDYGSPVGMRLAMRHPERVTALISQNGNAYEEGLSEGWNPIRAYWNAPTQENRSALRAMLAPETTTFQYTHGVADPSLVSPDGRSLDDFYLSRPGVDEIQLDLFLDYASNVALYPEFQAYLRAHQPPLLAVWGRNDPFFLPAGAEAFRRDVPNADVRFYDSGHFALETHAQEIGDAMIAFLSKAGNKASAGALGPVQAFYAALARGDVPAVLDVLDEKVQWTEAERFPYFSGTWIGPQAVLNNLLKRLAEDWEPFTAIAHDFIVDGNRVVSFGEYAGIHKKTGKSMTSAFAHSWTVADGKITSFLMYADTAKVLEAMR